MQHWATKMLMILYFVMLARGNEVIESGCSSLSIPHFYLNGHCYTFHDTPSTISDAESTCAQGFPEHPVLTGGRLAVLPNMTTISVLPNMTTLVVLPNMTAIAVQANTTIITAILEAVNKTDSGLMVWVGAFQEEPTTDVDGNWYWKENPVQTSTVKLAAIDATAGQPPWAADQPNDFVGEERCAVVSLGIVNGLGDVPCSITAPSFACEFYFQECKHPPAVSLRPTTTDPHKLNFEGRRSVKQEGSILVEFPSVPYGFMSCTKECYRYPLCTGFTQYDNGTCTLHFNPKGHHCYQEGHDPNAQLFEMVI